MLFDSMDRVWDMIPMLAGDFGGNHLGDFLLKSDQLCGLKVTPMRVAPDLCVGFCISQLDSHFDSCPVLAEAPVDDKTGKVIRSPLSMSPPDHTSIPGFPGTELAQQQVPLPNLFPDNLFPDRLSYSETGRISTEGHEPSKLDFGAFAAACDLIRFNPDLFTESRHIGALGDVDAHRVLLACDQIIALQGPAEFVGLNADNGICCLVKVLFPAEYLGGHGVAFYFVDLFRQSSL